MTYDLVNDNNDNNSATELYRYGDLHWQNILKINLSPS